MGNMFNPYNVGNSARAQNTVDNMQGNAPQVQARLGATTNSPAANPDFGQVQAGPVYGNNDMSALGMYKANPSNPNYRANRTDVLNQGKQYNIPADVTNKWYNNQYPPVPQAAPVQAAPNQGYDEAAARRRMGSGSLVGY